FDKLDDYGINVPKDDRLFRHFLTYDFEAYLEPVTNEGSQKLTFTHRHIPISVSVCSNVPGFTEAHCVVDSNMDALIERMIRYMSRIREECQRLNLVKFSNVFNKIEHEITRMEAGQLMVPLPNGDFEIFDDYETKNHCREMKKNVEKLRDQLVQYCDQIVCLGFNSSKYDCNLVKKCLAKHLHMDKSKSSFTVKRNNQYACLSNEHFKFLDITHYLAPGLSYAKFLKAFG
ncbi:hypothetical protein ScPMuIL_002230, partial [Solemya velum]